ncbi:MAG: threonylcarbamoyl-AMP synthase [Sphingobacteriales bacterium]|nr:MAG: threonylcarbamoyl-AMP synthase [Sphingobacteriales bacterium]
MGLWRTIRPFHKINNRNQIIMHKYRTEVGTNIERAAGILLTGGVVAMPTETVYGLAGNAYSINAITTIFEVKMRPFYNPLILHVESVEQLLKHSTEVSPLAIKLLEKFSPGPLTVIVPKTSVVPDLITNGLPDVAIRIPNHEVALQLLKMSPFPLVAPSANRFMRLSPTTAGHVLEQLGGSVPYVLDGGPCTSGIESTVVRVKDDVIEVHRVGAITIGQLKKVHPNVVLAVEGNSPSPGRMKQHYSPLTQMILTDDMERTIKLLKGGKVGVLTFSNTYRAPEGALTMNLSPAGSLEEAAQNLYRHLYELDKADLDFIVTALLPDIGLGQAINDRLRRAASTAA